LRGRVSGQASSDALAGVAWLADGRLLTAEAGRIVVRDPSTLEERCTIATTRRVFSLACVGDRWVASCVTDDGAGLLMGAADRVERFMRVGLVDVGSIAAWAGHASDAEVLVGSTSARSGVPMVALATPAPYVGTPDVLLEGEDFPVSALAADAKGRFVAAGDTNGRVWVWDRARSSALLRTGGESEASIAGPQPEPRFHYAFETAAGSLFRSWHRRPAGVAGAEAEEIYSPQDELFSQLARVGDEYLVISDGDDLVFMPVDEPARFTRRTAHDNPVKHLAAGATVVVSAACSFADTRIDVLMFWNPEGEPLGRVALPAHAMRIEIAAEERSIHVTDEYGRLWTVPLAIDEWAAVARIIAGRPLTDEEIRRYRIDSRRDVGSGA
jgi:hypothetical protein